MYLYNHLNFNLMQKSHKARGQGITTECNVRELLNAGLQLLSESESRPQGIKADRNLRRYGTYS